MPVFETSRYRRIQQKLKNRVTRTIPLKLSYLRLGAPIASFTFDDFPKSAWVVGGPIIESFGARATYYVAGGLSGKTENEVQCYDGDDLAALIQNGHDVGCHTYDHTAIPDLPSLAVEETLSKNRAFLKNITGHRRLTSFAYPFGLASIRTKALIKNKFVAARGVYPGINAGWVDFSQLNAIGLHRADLSIERYLEKTIERSGWVIFIGHDVADSPSAFGCTPKTLENVLKLVSTAGIEILTIDASLRRIFGPKMVPERNLL